MIKLNIHNETVKLKILITGIAHDMGGVPTIDKCFDPKSKEHVIAGTYPTNKACEKEIEALETQEKAMVNLNEDLIQQEKKVAKIKSKSAKEERKAEKKRAKEQKQHIQRLKALAHGWGNKLQWTYPPIYIN